MLPVQASRGRASGESPDRGRPAGGPPPALRERRIPPSRTRPSCVCHERRRGRRTFARATEGTMTELHQYLAEEVAEDHAYGIITRREAMRRLGLLGVSGAAASTLLAAQA